MVESWLAKSSPIELIPIRGIPEISNRDEIGQIIIQSCRKQGTPIRNNDILVITHKIVSKAEGRVLALNSVTPSKFAINSGRHIGKDPRQVEVILSESRRLVKMVRGLIIAETPHGFVCANAGVDQSNVQKGKVVLLPKKPDKSAQQIRDYIAAKTGKALAVIISDTFGRAWREGQTDVAIGIAGIEPFADYRGTRDQYGYDLKATIICIADELASAAELCMNKLDRVPAALIRGYKFKRGENVSSRTLARKPNRDLFR